VCYGLCNLYGKKLLSFTNKTINKLNGFCNKQVWIEEWERKDTKQCIKLILLNEEC
jgi:hypothetical protein